MINNMHQYFLIFLLLLFAPSLFAQEVSPQPTARQLLNPNWIENQLKEIGIDKLITKYNDHEQKEVRLVQSALDLSRHILRKHPEAVRHQLQARLISHQQPLLKPFQKLPSNKIQIVAMTPSLTQAGGAVIRTFGTGENWLKSAFFLADGKQIVSATFSKSIKFYDVSTGKLVRSIESSSVIQDIKMTSDRKKMVTISKDKFVRVWDVKSGKILHALPGNNARSYSLYLSPDGTKCVSNADRTRVGRGAFLFIPKPKLYCWDIITGKKLCTIEGRDSGCLTFTPDSKKIVMAKIDYPKGHHLDSQGSMITIWDVQTGEIVNQLKGRLVSEKNGKLVNEGPRYITITPDGKYAIMKSWGDETANLPQCDRGAQYAVINLKTGATHLYLNTFIPNYVFEYCTISIQGNKIIAKHAGRIHYEWNLKTGKMLNNNINKPRWLTTFAISPDGKQMLVRNGYGYQGVQLYNVQLKQKSPSPVKFVSRYYSISISKDETKVITGASDGTLTVWDFKTLKKIKIIKNVTDAYSGICITHDGKYAIVDRDDIIKMWDLKTGKVVRTFNDKKLPSVGNTLKLSPDGKEVCAIVSFDKFMRWNITTGKPELFSNKCHNQMTFTSDGKKIITGLHGKKFKIWDIKTSQLLKTVKDISPDISRFSISQDGQRLLIGLENGDVKLWKEQNNEANIFRVYQFHNKQINLLNYLPGDNFVFSACASTTFCIWNPKTNQRHATFYHEEWCRNKDSLLTPSGKYILSTGSNGKLYKYRIDNLPK